MRKAGSRAVSLLVLGVSAAACGGAPPPATTSPTATVAVVAPPPTASVATGPDLSPVSEPADIVGVARWRNPIGTVSNLASCAGVAPVIVEVNARMAVDQLLRRVLRAKMDTRKLAGLVSIDAPVDVVVALGADARPKPPLVAVSVGLASLDGAKLAIAPDGKATELSPGVWSMDGERGVACAVAASAGQTPARLVCAEREKSLALLAPYMARTMPGLDLGGPDMHVEARIGLVRKRYGEGITSFLRTAPGAVATEYGLGDQRFDRLLFEAATSTQEDAARLLGDLEKVTVEAKSERSGTCLRANADIDLVGTTSWTAATLADRLDRAASPPPIYWRLPKDSDLAFYGRGVDPARFGGVLTKGRELLDAALATEGITAATDRKKITDLLDLPFGKDTTTVLAHGAVDVPFPDPASKGAQTKIFEAAAARNVGWTLIGASEGPAAMKKQLKGLVDAYKLASVQAALKKEMGPTDSKMLPTVKAGAAPASLGAGAEALEITVPNIEVGAPEGGKPAPKVTVKLHVLLMGDGDATFVAIGAVKDDLVKRLLAAKSGAADKDTLAARGDLDPLRKGKQMLGGFVSAAAVGQKVSAFILGAAAANPGFIDSSELALAQSLLKLPNQGKTPLFVTTSGAPGATPRLSLTLEAQQGTFEDAKALLLGSYTFWSRMGILP